MPPRIAYFVNQYPKVSHSFIRREIHGLEAAGMDIVRYALRTDPSELVDVQDKAELEKTRYVLQHSPFKILGKCIASFWEGPRRFLSVLALALRMGLRSDRGLLRHGAYFAEACVLRHWLREEKVAHVHAHFGTNSAAVVMFSRLLGGPGYSFTVHGPEEFDKPEFIALGLKIRHAEFVVAISSFTRSQLYRWARLEDWPKIRIVRCGLGSDFIDASPAAVPDNRRLICVGRLCEQKGQLLLLEAAHRLAEEGLEFELVLAGDGPMRADIEAGIARYSLGGRVTITGWVSSETVREEILASRALVLPSFAEGLPVVIMEALALGRPVLTTYIAGIPELVADGVNGWLVPAGDVERLVEALRAVLAAPPAQLNQMGRHGHQCVAQRHSIERETQTLAGLIEAQLQPGGNK